MGITYIDTARSYGHAEQYLADWLLRHPDSDDITIAGTWGHTYTAAWRMDADVHEVKDYSTAAFDRRLRETCALLGDRLDLHQIHPVTPDSPALADTVLRRR